MAHAPSKQRRIKKQETKELNLIPIMNLFIVVIPLLMTIMVTVPLAMNEINLATKKQNLNEKPPEDLPKNITLNLYVDRFVIQVQDEKDTIEIPLQENGSYDYNTLNEQLRALKELNKDQETIFIAPEDNVLYDTLLRSIDVCKLNDFLYVNYQGQRTQYYEVR